jgi:RNA polymerase sigma-70 factor (ECF subfamily)
MDFRAGLAREVPYLRRFARGLAGDAAVADDLVQDCIERALRKQHLFDDKRPLRAWLFTMLRNLHVSGMRSQGRRGQAVPVEEAELADPAAPPEQERKLALGDIVEAWGRLPQPQREVLLLVAVEEMNYREIAEITGTPVGTVMSRISRARAALRAILHENGEPRLRRIK